MTRLPFKSVLATVALLSGANLTPALAADFGGNDRGYGYERGYFNRDSGRDYSQSPPQNQYRRVPDNFDEDNNGYRHRPNGGWGGPHHVDYIEARASYASDYLPDHVKEWHARYSAIEAWKAKVANRYGEQFAHWRQAEDKRVNCDGAAGSVYCTVSARPVRGWSRWGWNASW